MSGPRPPGPGPGGLGGPDATAGAPEEPRRRQLRMWRPHLDGLPDLLVPDGYHLRTYRPGDERAWGEIMETAGGIGREWTVEKVRQRLVSRPQFEAAGLFFATCDAEGERPVASACAWRGEEEEEGGRQAPCTWSAPYPPTVGGGWAGW